MVTKERPVGDMDGAWAVLGSRQLPHFLAPAGARRAGVQAVTVIDIPI